MKLMKVAKGEFVAKRQNKVMEWYLIQEGSVIEKLGFAEIELGKNAIIGILESDWFFCDYIAREDTTLVRIACTNSEDLKKIFQQNEKYRLLFLHAVIDQRQQTFALYKQLFEKANSIFQTTVESYENYQRICEQLFVQEQPFLRMETLHSLEMQHRVEDWEMSNSESLVTKYFKEYLQLMMKDDALCVGAIMEASAQVRRATLGISEMVNYLQYNKDLLLAESEKDLFHLYYATARNVARRGQDITPFQESMKKLVDEMNKLEFYQEEKIQHCLEQLEGVAGEEDSEEQLSVSEEDGVAYILKYAGCEGDYVGEFQANLQAYKDGKGKSDRNDLFNSARKWLSEQFFEIYRKVFLRVMEEGEKPTSVLGLFLNFGYMDSELIKEEYMQELLIMLDQISVFEGEHVYTVYAWLKAIYEGKKEPSKNEFDEDYQEMILNQKKRNEITETEWRALSTDVVKKVEFEIANMFRSGLKMTFGQVSRYMSILQSDDMIQSLRNMAVTTEKIEKALNNVRKIDYTVLYRDIPFSDEDKGIVNERLQIEVMPEVILFPTVGTRATVWQETEGASRRGAARLFFPMFTMMDLEDEMIRQMGNYRWGMCRFLQGIFWNDVTDLSLTSEYYDYLQFYKKNSDLSPDAKEKVKMAISKSRNNFREVFVMDYFNWVKYESRGSSRLNKVARRIMSTYCPFCKDIREVLKNNPAYELAFRRLEIQNEKKEKRLTRLYEKYQEAGGVITPELESNLNLCKM